jgi:hypothetical protein
MLVDAPTHRRYLQFRERAGRGRRTTTTKAGAGICSIRRQAIGVRPTGLPLPGPYVASRRRIYDAAPSSRYE